MSQINTKLVKEYLLSLQSIICTSLEKHENEKIFQQDEWSYHQSGGGIAKVLEEGITFEKAGVNFSHVIGKKLPEAATIKRPELAGYPFEAMGVSLVIHPHNPFVPTSHANFRLFVIYENSNNPVWWFGGGYDLTPYYGFKEDCIHWHKTAQQACMPFGEYLYQDYKKNCDNYFFLKHRSEPRGIGGLFFDDVNQWSFDQTFQLIQNIGNSFIDAYGPIVEKRKQHPFLEHHKKFQNYRRGRYVEFNLVLDRGTLFGLQSKARTESILMSLPPVAHWNYNWQPGKNSPEKILYDYYLQPKDWASMK